MKVRDYLRGQKVPLHLRDSTELLFMEVQQQQQQPEHQPVHETQELQRQHVLRQLVAVRVNEKWMVDQQFSMVSVNNQTATNNDDNDVDNDVDNENTTTIIVKSIS